jgi:hypothetical protein
MADKNMIDAVQISLKLHQLHLSSFPAINKKTSALDLNQLRRSEPAIRWHGTART